MARSRNGTGDLTTQVLISIRDEIRHLRTDTNRRLDEVTGGLDQVNGRLDQVNGRLDEVNGRVDKLREETRSGLQAVHHSLSRRLDKLIENTGAHWRKLDDRVGRLERDVAVLKHR